MSVTRTFYSVPALVSRLWTHTFVIRFHRLVKRRSLVRTSGGIEFTQKIYVFSSFVVLILLFLLLLLLLPPLPPPPSSSSSVLLLLQSSRPLFRSTLVYDVIGKFCSWSENCRCIIIMLSNFIGYVNACS